MIFSEQVKTTTFVTICCNNLYLLGLIKINVSDTTDIKRFKKIILFNSWIWLFSFLCDYVRIKTDKEK